MDWPSRSAGARLLVDFKADINAMLGKQTLLMKAGFGHVQTMRYSVFMLSTFDVCPAHYHYIINPFCAIFKSRCQWLVWLM